MKTTSRAIGIIITTICIGILSASSARAAHATNFLDALYSEVTNRVANPGTNTAAQKAALRAANNILNRNTRTLSADVSALATAATVLGTRFRNDAVLLQLENQALAAYSAEGHAQLDAAEARIGTNAIPRLVRSQLNQASNALARADANTNSVPSRAKALSQALNKIRVAVAKVSRINFPVPPEPPFEAPADIATAKAITATEMAPSVSETTIYYLHTLNAARERFLHYTSDNPEEVGRWSYTRTGMKTAVVQFNVDFFGPDCGVPAGRGTPHTFSLTFTSATAGTFVGTNCRGEQISGTFVISNE